MEMASASGLLERAYPVDPCSDGMDSVRCVSLAEAKAPEFIAEWEVLAERASEPNPFFEPWFALPSFDAFAPGKSVSLLTSYHEGRLTGLLPLGRTANYYGYPIPNAASWLHANAFCGAPLVARGYERAFWRGLLSHLDRRTGLALFLHLPNLPSGGPLSSALADVLEADGRNSYVALEQSRASLASELSSTEYLAQSMSAKKRKELRRQHKRLSEEGVLQVRRTDGADEVEQWTADFIALEAAGWKGEAGSALGSAIETQEFFAATLREAADAGKLERLTLALDGRPIAMLANFVTAPGVFSFKTAFDEAYSRFSPGMLLQLENLALLDREGIKWADSCAVEGHPMIERLWRQKRTLKSHNIAIGGRLRRAAFRQLMAYETRNRSAS